METETSGTDPGLAGELTEAKRPFVAVIESLASVGVGNEADYQRLTTLGDQVARLQGLRYIERQITQFLEHANCLFSQLVAACPAEDPWFQPYTPSKLSTSQSTRLPRLRNVEGYSQETLDRAIPVVATTAVFSQVYLHRETDLSRPTTRQFITRSLGYRLIERVVEPPVIAPEHGRSPLFRRTSILDRYIAANPDWQAAIRKRELEKYIGENFADLKRVLL